MRPCETPVRCIFVCSRYAGNVARNTEIAEQLCRIIADAGYAPFAPHLLYTRFLNNEHPVERERGITLGLLFMDACA